ncbi:MAG TPA: tryptophan--tRNA ligase [Candidatus Paceibacterota bacterium]|nr:tryptophan--tRNA ligase [Candidatus Paceibacterota bacterium]
MAEQKKRILTGDTPTGKLHLGHWVGTLENRVKLQDEYDTFIINADTHALTTLSKDPARVHQSVLEVAKDNLAVGLDPEKVTMFVESEVPEIYELAAIFSMYVSHNEALRNPTVKDEIKTKGMGDIYSLGFINYPIYQAADIVSVRGELVPVGVDQEAHLEQTREIVRSINTIAGSDMLIEPKALVGRVGKLMGTDGNPKMGKSLGNTIYLSDSEEEITKKVMGMYTDPNRIHPTDPGKVEGNPVFVYLDVFANEHERMQVAEYKEKYTLGKVGDIEVKKFLAGILNNFISPIRERRTYYDNNTEEVIKILNKGNARAREEAQKTLSQVKKTVGLSI